MDVKDYIGQGNDNALKVRIETDGLLDSVEEFLTGKKTFYVQGADGQMTIQKIKFGSPLVNEEGNQQLLQFCSQIINKHTVQGNMKEAQIFRMLKDFQQHLAYILMLNRVRWGVGQNNRNHILTCIMGALEPFLSRLKDNKERESYDNTLKMVETNTIRDNSSQGFNLFGGGKTKT